MRLWPRLEMERDLLSIFLGKDAIYLILDGLRMAGMEG